VRAWVKAKMILLGIVIVWSALIFLTWRGWYQVALTLIAIPFKRLRPYRYNLWIAQDQDVNVIFGGNPDITISSKIGYMKLQGSKTASAMAVVVDFLFLVAVGQHNHCVASIERDEAHYTKEK